MTTNITEPGIYDLAPADYHNVTTINGEHLASQSAFKHLIEEAGPARYRAYMDKPRVEKKVFDLGTGLHAILLGKGQERLEIVPFADYRTKDAREARDNAYANGLTPLKQDEWDNLQAVADTIPAHIRDIFTDGNAEQALIGRHHTGLWQKGQLDYVKPGEMLIDLKTTRSTDTRPFERHIWDYGYYFQAAWYRNLYEQLTGEALRYVIVAIDLTAPHLSRFFEITDEYIDYGTTKINESIDLYHQCTETGEWPGYGKTAYPVLPPDWAYDDIEMEMNI